MLAETILVGSRGHLKSHKRQNLVSRAPYGGSLFILPTFLNGTWNFSCSNFHTIQHVSYVFLLRTLAQSRTYNNQREG